MPQDSVRPPLEQALHIASQFDIQGPLEAMDFAGKGNINKETYLITAKADPSGEFLLQKINPDIFNQPSLVMRSMIACIEAQRIALAQNALLKNEEWEPIQLVRTRNGENYLEIADQSGTACWRMMVKIPDSHSYKSLWSLNNSGERLRIAEETAKGLALFGNLTSAMPIAGLEPSLPGYRDTQIYYNQLQSIVNGARTIQQAAELLPSDPVVKQCTEQHFLVHAEEDKYQLRMADPQVRRMVASAWEQKGFALSLKNDLHSGRLSISVIHGDTKLENFLFSGRTGKVKSLVDLDTIMPHCWLSDWGDMARSLSNAAGEKEPNIDKIDVDLEVFQAMARGFLNSVRSVQSSELHRMVDAAQIMSLELGVRFLADYIRGDSYFRLSPNDPEDLNKIRAMVQFAVFEKFRAKADAAYRYIKELI